MARSEDNQDYSQPGTSASPDDSAASVGEPKIKWKEKGTKINEKLCNALIASDVPLNKLSCLPYSFVLNTVPDQSTLRKYYVSNIYNEQLTSQKRKAQNQKLWIYINETTNVYGRYVAYFVFGILGVGHEKKKRYLGYEAVFEKVNHATASAFINGSLQLL